MSNEWHEITLRKNIQLIKLKNYAIHNAKLMYVKLAAYVLSSNKGSTHIIVFSWQ